MTAETAGERAAILHDDELHQHVPPSALPNDGVRNSGDIGIDLAPPAGPRFADKFHCHEGPVRVPFRHENIFHPHIGIGQSGPEGPEGAEGAEGPTGSRESQGLRGYDGPSGSEEADFTDFISDSRDGIVLVGDTGSGVRISHSEIITAQYVVGTQIDDSVTIKGIGKVLATVKGYDTSRDIALLTTSSHSSGNVVDYSQNGETWNSTEGRFHYGAQVGDEIAIVGYETSISDTTPIITYGRVGGRWNIIPDDISAIQTDAAVTPGMSGGGVFNKYGELVGMLYSSTTKDNVNARILLTDEISEIVPKLKTGQKR